MPREDTGHGGAARLAEAAGAQARDAAAFAGDDDGFGRLWTPYRMAYINGDHKPADSSSGECPFCAAPGRSDEDALIVHRGATCFVLMNLFPYNAGHMLVCPYRHVSDYTDLSAGERAEFGELTATAMRVERATARPQGFNLGMNQGAVAGAGIAAHLHQHIVPRWAGDANFFPIVARTKAIPELLEDARSRLAAAWPRAGEDGAAPRTGPTTPRTQED
ncbi:MAG: HIT domain-containing protein [Actinomyces sp.]|jgi:ATP adenylyltransferase|nr:HIT domain-containing protein [Actinomyces sp.]MCI1641059.1 HIT domain-containing protein [Actinomyces sp.]MCI1661427.1 HIT domain-containing protein [Actinomyces sp.]MCI1690435.1 HIT domain-containing protein [Actinomyces sp.]MCI1787076.1 HIT domain-containing protein [Actinomyces sp.]MCI1829358.1 HIT domain-containing protein [Actinomyces sp.]